MSLHYLVDGYNLLYALPELPAGSLEQKRDALVRLILREKPQGKNSLTIVFDSRQGMGDTLSQEGVTLVYTAGETADDWISRKVRQMPHPATIVVVSNDRGIQTLIRGTGAKFMPTADFLKKGQPPPQRSGPASGSDASAEITEEFKKKWL